MKKRQRLMLLAGGLMASVLGYVARGARAGGVPSAPHTMAYTGVLTDTMGKSIAVPTQVEVSLWSDPTALTTEAQLCPTPPASLSTYTSPPSSSDGSFSVPLGSDCVAAIHANPNVWVQLQVVGAAMPMARVQLGAVPYALETARTTYVSPTTQQQYSVGAAFCNPTTASYTGDLKDAVAGSLNGYAAAKSLCQTACGSLSAHMCTNDELIRTMATGGTIPVTGWYAAGIEVSGTANGCLITDCNAHTDGSGSTDAYSWGPSGPGQVYCNQSQQVLCCD